MDEARIEIGLGAVQNPTYAGLAIGADDVVGRGAGRAVGSDEGDVADAIDEIAFCAEVAIARAAPECGPIGLEGTEAVFTTEIHVTKALVAVDEVGGDVDEGRSGRAGGGVGGGRHGADGRDAVGPAGDDASVRGVGHGGLATGESADLILAAHRLGGIVVN